MNLSTLNKTEELRNLLISTHLHYDVESKVLKAKALAEIFMKTLYLSPNHKMKSDRIASESAKLIKSKQIPPEDVKLGVNLLVEKRIVCEQNNDFLVLSSEAIMNIEKDVDNCRNIIKRIVKKNFSPRIKEDILVQWFNRASIDFFSEYESILTNSFLQEQDTNINIPNKEFIEKAITKSIKDYELNNFSNDLIIGFRDFLKNYSNDRDIDFYMEMFAQAILSAKSIKATVGPDSITINEFRDAKLFIDTNVLLIAVLEKSKHFKIFSEFAKSLKDVNATLHFIRPTKDEYRRVVTIKKERALRIVEEYEMDILRKSSDMFLKTAIARGCNNRESFEIFFDSIGNIPDKIDGGAVKINFEESPDIAQAIESGAKDTDLQEKIKKEWKRYPHLKKSKSENSAKHDAELNSVAEMFKKKREKIWVITMDRSMHSLSLHLERKKFPLWITFEVLVRILAIYGAGPAHNPRDLVSLLRIIIENEIQTSNRTYTLKDLTEAYNRNKRIGELSTDKIENLLLNFGRSELSEKPNDLEQAQLELRRALEPKEASTPEIVSDLQNRIKLSEEKNKETINFLTKEFRLCLRKWIYIKNIGLFVIFLIIGLCILKYGIDKLSTDKDLAYILIPSAIFSIIIPLIFWIKPKTKKELENANKQSRKKANEKNRSKSE